MTNKQKKIVEKLSEFQKYYNYPLDYEITKVYIAVLDTYTEEELSKVFMQVLIKCKYFPKLAEIEELVGHTEARNKSELNIKAHLAFDEAVSEMSRTGSYNAPTFEDPLIPSVIKASFNGWIRFGLIMINEWTRRAFVEKYVAIHEAGMSQQIRLTGIHDLGKLNGESKQIGYWMHRNSKKRKSRG